MSSSRKDTPLILLNLPQLEPPLSASRSRNLPALAHGRCTGSLRAASTGTNLHPDIINKVHRPRSAIYLYDSKVMLCTIPVVLL